MSVKEYREYVCPEEGCHSVFKTLSHMNTHLLVHSCERPFVCPHDDCPVSFKRAGHLRRHEQQCHEKASSVVCPWEGCSLSFCSAVSLKRHEKRIHLEPKYKCSVCSVVLSKKRQLHIHEAQHTEEKPFRCSIEGCKQAFSTPSRLTVHQKQHKGYECSAEGCSAIFYKWSLLLQHKRIEHPRTYTCSQCGKTFHSSFNLKKHQVVHSETRDVLHCPQEGCSRQYFDLKNLNSHLKRFHQEQCFICTFEGCQRKFAHKKSLASHLENHLKPKVKKPKSKKNQRYNFVKRRSAAAMLSGHDAEKEAEKAILEQDRELTLAGVKRQLEELAKFRDESVNKVVDTQTAQHCLIMQNA